MKCDCVEHGPPVNPYRKPCGRQATHRLENEDGWAYLCGRHTKALRDMYEPGQIRKLRAAVPSSTPTESK